VSNERLARFRRGIESFLRVRVVVLHGLLWSAHGVIINHEHQLDESLALVIEEFAEVAHCHWIHDETKAFQEDAAFPKQMRSTSPKTIERQENLINFPWERAL
jgi:hypothetical protein